MMFDSNIFCFYRLFSPANWSLGFCYLDISYLTFCEACRLLLLTLTIRTDMDYWNIELYL